jgi:acetyl-CoA synthetase
MDRERHAMKTIGAAAAFFASRDVILKHRTDYATAMREFRWPAHEQFNWALDYFDTIAADNHRPALHIVEEDGRETIRSFAELSTASDRVANFLRGLGARRGDCVLLMLGNEVALWETLLAAIKLGVIITPATTLLTTDDLQDRVDRGHVRHVITSAINASKFDAVRGTYTRIAVGDAPAGWHGYDAARYADAAFAPSEATHGSEPMLLYFTSGTTAKPKLVVHTHQSYPVGHLSTMYWIGVQAGDRHWNISSPGWAKHAWSSFFAPWNAEATIFIFNYARFNAAAVLDALVRYRVTTLCAPPTVWRMLIQQPLGEYRVSLREALSAGEPLNPEVIDQEQKAWGLTIRDGYGQTETTAQIGNSPGQPLKVGSMGRPLPGYDVVLLDPDGRESETEGEVCLRLDNRPLGLTPGYADDQVKTSDVMRDGYYHTGDIASRDSDGYLTFIGRADDVFKASDHRLSPFELESVLIEFVAVAEAAVVPSPDPLRHAVPKAFVTLAAGFSPSRELAAEILSHCRTRLAPFKRIRRIEFAVLPKTISGKIRRVELRQLEATRRAAGGRSVDEFFEEDL